MAEDAQARSAAEEAELMKRFEEQVRSLSVGDHIAYMLESLAALATRKLGLTSDTVAERDTDQARLAIDAFKALLQVVEPARSQAEVTGHRGVLSQLQLAYVRVLEGPPRSAKPESGPEQGSPGAEGDEADAQNDEPDAETGAVPAEEEAE